MVPSTVYCDNCGAANRPQARFCITCGQPMAAASSLPPAGSTPNAAFLTGLLTPHTLLKQRYHILSRLGQGGMGAVYKAQDIQLGDRLVAVKEMSQRGLDQQELMEAAEAFKREAHMLASLFHRYLLRIYDHFSDGGRWYLVMDYIAGETLEEHLAKTGGKLPIEEALDIGIQLCTVIGYLHQQQPQPIIFRDLKPANVMHTPDGDLYLIDFGIARLFKPGKTKDTTAYGSDGYSAPEQYGKGQTTPQSDIYSLGATLHQLLTGDDPALTPFRFAPLSGTALPIGLGTLIAQMVEMDVDKRPPSVAEVKQELQRIRHLAAQTHVAGTLHKTKEEWLKEGSALYGLKRYDEALAAFEQALRLDPNNAVAYKIKGFALYTLKRYDEALAAYEQALRLDPNNAVVHSNKGNALRDLKRYGEALAAYEQALRLDPNNAAAHNNMGDALYALKRYDQALAAYKQALRLDPNYAAAHKNMGDVFYALKRYDQALAAYEQALHLNPNYAAAYHNKGSTLYDLKRPQEALAAYERALRLDPNFAVAHNNKGNVLYGLKRYDEVLATFEQALRLDPNFAVAHNNKGNAFERLGKKREAQQAYEKARQLGYKGQ